MIQVELVKIVKKVLGTTVISTKLFRSTPQPHHK